MAAIAIGGCSGSENPGLLVQVQVPLGALPLEKLVLTVDREGTPFTAQPEATQSGVIVRSENGKVTLEFIQGAFDLRSSFDVLLRAPAAPFPVRVSGQMFKSGGKFVGLAESSAPVTVETQSRARVAVMFRCAIANCTPVEGAPGTVDLAQPPTVPRVIQAAGQDNDRLVPLATGHFSTDPLRGDVVLAARGTGHLYLFWGGDWSVPGAATLDPTFADVHILPKTSERPGDAAAVGDLDGDGIDDLVVTAVNGTYAGGPTAAGVAYILLGKKLKDIPPGGTIDLATDTTVPRIYGGANERLGQSVALAKLNSTQYADLLLGAPGAVGGKGAVYAIFGRDNPVAELRVADAGAQSEIGRVLGSATASPIGLALAAGSLDGDGKAEVAIGASLEAMKGAVYVLRPDPIVPGAVLDLAMGAYAARVTGTPFSQFGWSVATGDVNGDGTRELVVGARNAESGSGTVYLLRPTLGTTLEQDVAQGQFVLALVGPTASSFGTALALGNVDGDASLDLLVGAPGHDALGTRTDAGVSYLFRGSALSVLTGSLVASEGTAALTIYGASANAALGRFLAITNFDTADATSELIVGTDTGTTNMGAVYAIQGLP